MNRVANLIATIENEMDVESEALARVNPEHLRMVEALLFAAERAAGSESTGNIAAGRRRCAGADFRASSDL